MTLQPTLDVRKQKGLKISKTRLRHFSILFPVKRDHIGFLIKKTNLPCLDCVCTREILLATALPARTYADTNAYQVL